MTFSTCEYVEFEEEEEEDLFNSIRLNCRRHEKGHLLCVKNFELLELAESMLGTSLQRMVHLHLDDYVRPSIRRSDYADDLQLLLQRINRQNESLPVLSTKFVVLAGTIENRKFITLLKHTSQWDICRIVLRGDFGKEDWSKLAEAMNYMKKNENLRVAVVKMSREVMLRGSNEDLQTAWE